MRHFHLFILFVFLFSFQTVSAVSVNFPDCAITSTLRVGSKGVEVQCLQKSLKLFADGIFGPLTKIAVKSFQSSKGLVADGIVGPLSRVVFNALIAKSGNYPAGCISDIGYSKTTGVKCDISLSSLPLKKEGSSVTNNSVIPKVSPPKVFSVSPEKVRSGDIIKIYGENFSSTSNTVRLRYGQIEARFENVTSSDGKMISFAYQPPEVKTMNKEELLSLLPTELKKILDPIKAAGGSIDDIVTPYRNMRNEDELKRFLENNGHTIDELDHKFYVTVENTYGRGSSGKAILSGSRKLSFASSLASSENKNFLSIIRSLFEVFAPRKAYAQLWEGGTNSGIITECTCGPGYLTIMTDQLGVGSGFYWWPPGLIYAPASGNSMVPAPNQLGLYTPKAGQCWMDAGPYCFPIIANIVNPNWGQNP